MVGGDRVGERGYVDEEIFGPVVTAIPFKDLDEVTPAAKLFRGYKQSDRGGRWAKR